MCQNPIFFTDSFKTDVDASRTLACPVTDSASFMRRALMVGTGHSLALSTGKHLFLISVLSQD